MDLEQQHQLMESLFHATPNGMLLLDDTGNILLANDGMAAISGFSLRKLNACQMAELLEPEDWLAIEKWLQSLSSGERQTASWKMRLKHASNRWVDAEIGCSQIATLEGPRTIVSVVDNSDRLAAENRVAQREQELRMITNGVPVLISYVDRDLRYRFANQRYCELWNLSAEEIVGRPVGELLGDEAFAIAKPLLERALQGETTRDEILVRGGQQPFWASVVYTPDIVNGEICGVFTTKANITEVKEAETRFNRALDGAGVGIFDWDAKTSQFFASPRFWEIVDRKYQGPWCNAEDYHSWVHPDDRQRVRDRFQQYLDGGMRSHEDRYRVLGDSGNYRWIHIRATMQPDALGQTMRVAGSISNIDDLKEYEQAMQDQIDNRDRFLAVLSHELRNPLGAVSNALKILQLSNRPEDQAQAKQLMESQLKHVIRLLDDLLDISRYVYDKVAIVCRPLDLRTIAEEAVESSQLQAAEKQIQLYLDVPAEACIVDADADRIFQCFANLFSNAIRYTPKNGEVRVVLERGESTVRVSVTDTGIGLDKSDAERVFELFFQTKHRAQVSGGLGIGLSLVKRIADAHSGTISAQSAGPGQGTTFTLELPACLPETRPVLAPDHEIPSTPPAANGLIVLVDDLAPGRKLLASLLENFGYQVIQATNGAEAIGLIGKHRPFAALVDLGLPDISGLQVAQEVRGEAELAEVLLIAVTGFGTPQDIQLSLDSGFDDHLVKPVNLKTLLEKLSGPHGGSKALG